MSKNPSVMACGCTVVFEEEGKMVTSIDTLVSTLRFLFGRKKTHKVPTQTTVAAHM